MVHIKIDDLLNIAKQISSQYQMILEKCQEELNSHGKFIDLEMQKRLKK